MTPWLCPCKRAKELCETATADPPCVAFPDVVAPHEASFEAEAQPTALPGDTSSPPCTEPWLSDAPNVGAASVFSAAPSIAPSSAPVASAAVAAPDDAVTAAAPRTDLCRAAGVRRGRSFFGAHFRVLRGARSFRSLCEAFVFVSHCGTPSSELPEDDDDDDDELDEEELEAAQVRLFFCASPTSDGIEGAPVLDLTCASGGVSALSP